MTLEEKDELKRTLEGRNEHYVSDPMLLNSDSNNIYFDIELPFDVVDNLLNTPLITDDGNRAYPNSIEKLFYDRPVICSSLVDGYQVLYSDYYWLDTGEMLNEQDRQELFG